MIIYLFRTMKRRHGNLVDWWEDDTEAKFAGKAHCMVEQVWDLKTTDVTHPICFQNDVILLTFNISNSIQIMWILTQI